MARFHVISLVLGAFLQLAFGSLPALAKECPAGFDWQPNSGVGCVQKDCFDRGGHWSSTQQCICNDGQKPCRCPVDYSGFDDEKCFPDCPFTRLVSCVPVDSECPSCDGDTGPEATASARVNSQPARIGGRVDYVFGRVEAREGPGKPWRRLYTGAPLGDGWEVRTFLRARTEIYLVHRGMTLRLESRSHVRISGPRPSREDPSFVQLFRGFLWAGLKRLVGTEERVICTPTSCTGLRGTELITLHDPERGRDDIIVREGAVEVRGSVEGRAEVRGGQRIRVDQGVVGTVQPMDPDDWSALVAPFEESESAPAGSASATNSRQRFVDPEIDGVRLDWCRVYGGECGQPAADAFCRRRGYERAERFLAPNAGPTTTKVISSGEECQGPICTTFFLVECASGNPPPPPEPPTHGCRGIEGTWDWYNGVTVWCEDDGYCRSSGSFIGPVTCLDPEGVFRIPWKREDRPEVFIDTLTLSPDGNRLEGQNQHGVPVTGTRRRQR